MRRKNLTKQSFRSFIKERVSEREMEKKEKSRKIFSFIIPHKNTNKLIKMEDNAFGLNRFER